MRSLGRLCLVLAALGGCTTRLGGAPLLARDPDVVGTKLLRPEVSARSCRTTVVGIAVGDDAAGGTIDDAMARLLALDEEGNVVTNATLEEERMTTGVVNRRCITVRGDLARGIRTVIVPTAPGHHGHLAR
jgi:hypothetical protein